MGDILEQLIFLKKLREIQKILLLWILWKNLFILDILNFYLLRKVNTLEIFILEKMINLIIISFDI